MIKKIVLVSVFVAFLGLTLSQVNLVSAKNNNPHKPTKPLTSPRGHGHN